MVATRRLGWVSTLAPGISAPPPFAFWSKGYLPDSLALSAAWQKEHPKVPRSLVPRPPESFSCTNHGEHLEPAAARLFLPHPAGTEADLTVAKAKKPTHPRSVRRLLLADCFLNCVPWGVRIPKPRGSSDLPEQLLHRPRLTHPPLAWPGLTSSLHPGWMGPHQGRKAVALAWARAKRGAPSFPLQASPGQPTALTGRRASSFASQMGRR